MAKGCLFSVIAVTLDQAFTIKACLVHWGSVHAECRGTSLSRFGHAESRGQRRSGQHHHGDNEADWGNNRIKPFGCLESVVKLGMHF
ncbi:hypothetical protein CLU79DRAFT_756534, partial [Phycomyces nitens]